MGSQRVVQGYLIHPSELKGLETGHAVFKAGRRFGRLILPGHFPNVDEISLPQRRENPPSLSPVPTAVEAVEIPF